MIKKVISLISLLIALFLLAAAFQSDDFHVSRSTTMAASAETVFAQVNNLQRWNDWSPWAKIDPNAKTTFEGPAEGEGAVMRWDGNSDVGKGSMTLIKSNPSQFIRFRLDFLEPFAGTNTAEFTFEPKGNQTAVTWTMYGPKNYFAKILGLIFNCDKMVGGEFEKGLATLKSVAEKKQAEAPAAINAPE